MVEKGKILLWAPLGSGLHYWGPGISAFNLYKDLDKEKYEIHLAHGYVDQADYPLFDTQINISNLVFKSGLSQLIFLYKSFLWLKKNANKYDVMHVLSPHHIGFLPAFWFEKFNKRGKSFIKFTAKNDGFGDNSKVSRLLQLNKKRVKIAKKLRGKLIAISSEIYKDILSADISSSQTVLIPNGVDCSRFNFVSEDERRIRKSELGLPDLFTLIFTGGLTHRKGPSLIVEAFNELVEKNKEINVIIIGPIRDDGSELQKIKDRMGADSNTCRILLLDHITNVEWYYATSDAFILPSQNEGMSNSLLEALASGLPSLVTNISGSNDLVQNGSNGFFINRDPLDIAEKVSFYLDNILLLESHKIAARKCVVENYSKEEILQNHLILFFPNAK